MTIISFVIIINNYYYHNTNSRLDYNNNKFINDDDNDTSTSSPLKMHVIYLFYKYNDTKNTRKLPVQRKRLQMQSKLKRKNKAQSEECIQLGL